MNTTQLDCFLAVANFLNFSRAADHLHISQPAVSHQINALEDELGCRLFHRTSKSVRLTQEGYLFIEYASDILKLSGLSKARVKESQKRMAKRLVIGWRSTAELQFILPALEHLRECVSDVVPMLRVITSDALESLLEEGEIQIAFSFGRGEVKQAHYHELTRCPAVCVCKESHPLAENSSLTLAQLRKAGQIAICRPPICPPKLFLVQNQVIVSRSPGEIFFCDSQEAVFALVQTGYAFCVTADLPHTRQPGLRYIPLPEIPPLSFGAFSPQKSRNPIIRQFLELLEQSLPRLEPGSLPPT